MRGYNKPNTQKPAKTIDLSAPAKRPRNDGVIVNPEVNQNRLNNYSKGAASINSRLTRDQVTATRRQNVETTSINRFKVSSQQPQQKASPPIVKTFVSRPAPSNQFKRYLSDTENIFYEDSPNMKNLRRIKVGKFYLSIFIAILAICYIGINRIMPYPKEKCPPHAVCNVFIHCHKGYARQGGTCIIDPQVVNKAKEISEAVVTQLSYNFGELQCSSEGQSLPILAKIQDVFREFNAEDDVLKNEIIYFFINKQNQAKYQFTYRLNTITALSKMYSLSCSTNLFIRSSKFKYYLLALAFLIVLAIKCIKRFIEYKKAQNIYLFLKRKTLGENQLCINEIKKEVEGLYGGWTEELWAKVDRIRSQDGSIAYYVELEQVFWKRID